MATVQYNTVSTVVNMVQWTGTNLDEVIAFVGAAAVRYESGVLEVNGIVIDINDRLALNDADDTFHGRVRASKIGIDYTAV